ncbi:phosphate ABC transporter substrate-binding/OmpA family protein [Marivita hallyeonensis]|uniref:Phosphate ABC transporter substrate-binding protein, PhoT family n=1 Tax=Marivita hallyeonensis TaxID=996342 RepID=A0A1M5LRA3_9RHOB|nr:phosphate ABC transporter substrate-binding/OmpA family protein [Marivita hallyeonensis]SHG67654.1 phosphate ABC transporter substrate-binding protein, PhoT family [Marivita hallyeonensis]
MSNLMSRLKRSAQSAALLASASLVPTVASAGEVALKSADGTVNLTGEFVEFTDDYYVIRTALGELRISAARVRCEGDACPTFDTESADLQFAGSDAMGVGLMPLLLSGYASYLDAEASIVETAQEGQLLADFISDGGFGDEIGSYLVTATSTDDAFSALMSGEAQIGMASRRIVPDEARALKAEGAGNMIDPNQEHIIAVDSVVVITHPSNPVSQITMEQMREIYAGRISNWSELGGEDMPIQVISRAKDSGARATFEASIFEDLEVVHSESEIIAASNNEMAALVNENPAAIGFVPYAFQRGAKPMSLVNACGIVSEPDAFSAKTEEYPLERRLYFYNRADTNNQLADDFLKYALSEDADGVIAKAGFIDLGIKRRPQSMEGQRARMLLDPNADAYEAGVMREMLGQMVDYDRLSTTFRFRTGSSRLDERGVIDMQRLVDFLEDQPEGTKIVFVGFTDDVGAFDSNRALSKNRAAAVADTLRETAGDRIAHVEIEAAGFGEVAPAACNATEKGRSINRRVEVWIEAGMQG